MADLIEIEKQAKDAVAAVIAKDAVSGTALTVPVICQHISHAARASKEPKEPKDAIVAVCRGAMNAVFLGGQSVPDAAVALLEALPNMSLMMRTGPEDLMSWVMEGIADVTPLAGPDVRDALRAKIEEKFMGASAIFDGLCEAAARKNRA